jgi:hypothetical protein
VLQAVESPADRLDTAKKLGVSSVVVDILLAQKDRIALARKLKHLFLSFNVPLFPIFIKTIQLWNGFKGRLRNSEHSL